MVVELAWRVKWPNMSSTASVRPILTSSVDIAHANAILPLTPWRAMPALPLHYPLDHCQLWDAGRRADGLDAVRGGGVRRREL